MSAWSEVRRLARQRHAELAGGTDALVPAATLLAAAERATGVRRVACPHGDPLLDGAEAAYDHDRKRIYYARETTQDLANFHVTHEFGHHWLDEAGACCAASDLDVSVPAEPSMSLVGEVDAYSPKEREEAQANLFAREFLLPREKLRQRCAGGVFDAASIAAEIGVPEDLVLQQLADALLLPEEREVEEAPQSEHAPDESQQEAIECESGPRQVRAGPGSGKTRTLVGRIVHLVTKGEDPSSILALTYSNLSAQDLTSRIRAAIGDKVTAVWAGTFHAYGLELLRKYGSHLGMTSPPKLLDRTDCLMLLEELLHLLDLDHYLNLYEPVLAIKAILGAIGRAKDELVGPQKYTELAQAMRDKASDAKELESAERALEVARTYGIYERTLRERGFVDFGDLVALPVGLLREHPEVRNAVCAERRHVLVDEYQDMNRASAMLLKQIVPDGRGPWVVGDVRQAIYRFRGASPVNMSRFGEDFPGAETTDLSVNYRSGGKIVRAFETFGGYMVAGKLSPQMPSMAHRGEETGTVTYTIASTREAEANGIAEWIKERVAQGGKYGDHAVLCRAHTALARLARHLERCGVPCLYFGDFFERPEVRDLLALLSLVAEPLGPALLHVAQRPQYAVPPSDIVAVFAWRDAQKLPMPTVLGRLDEIEGLSPAGRDGLRRLQKDVSFSDWPMRPHQFLMRYLFGGSGHLRELLADRSVVGQQRLLAVYQLLQFAFAYKPPEKGDPKRAFLNHIRKLEILDEEKQLRQLPAAASDIDAVRLMTVHASKGLEFPVVHIAGLAKGIFPGKSRAEGCPPPHGMIRPDNLMTSEAEEDSLFFVAMSRARDSLHLSRSLTNGLVNTTPSRFLELIAGHLPIVIDGAATWTSPGPKEPPHPRLHPGPAKTEWTASEIETYEDCPRRYYYAHVLELSGSENASPYLKFQSAIHSSIAWLRSVPSPDRRAGIDTQFESDWSSFGPSGHALEPLYRPIARRMVDHAITVMEGESVAIERTVTLPGSGTVIRCKADHVQLTPQGAVVFRLKASTLAKKEGTKTRYELVQAAVCRDHGHASVTLTHVSLLTGEQQRTTAKRAKLEERLQELEDVITGVADGNFDPNPSNKCPGCPYYFICPSPGTLL